MIYSVSGATVGDNVSPYVALDVSTLSTDFANISFMFAAPIHLPAGTYAVGTASGDALSGDIYWDGSVFRGYPPAPCYIGDTFDAEQGNSYYFLILGDGSVNQDEVAVDTDAEAILDNIEITFDTPPYIAVIAKEEIYSYDAVLENETTGQAITIHFISALNESLTINCETKQVTGGELGLSVPYAIECTDEVDWLYLVPGVNALKYTEASLGTIGLVATWRGRWS
jgi:hypothetical protein